MDIYSLLSASAGIVLIVVFSVLAARAEGEASRKCSREAACRQDQEQITTGKAHTR